MPRSIKDRVAIVGMGCTKFGERWDVGGGDLLVEASYEAFEDAGIGPEDIEAAWVGTLYSGSSGMTLGGPLRLPYIPITRVENMCASGSDSLRQACYAVAAGMYDIALAIGVEKLKDSGLSGLPTGGGFSSGLGAGGGSVPAIFALLATTYFARYGLSYEEGKHMIGRVSWKSHQNGSKNPKAHFQNAVTMETILNAPIMASPLGLFDCCGNSDGSAAAIVTTPEIAKSLRKGKEPPLFIKALQICISPQDGGLTQRYD